MRNLLGHGTVLGYCTNVHSGATYEQVLAGLQQHALSVKEQVSPDAPMGVGLWLSAQTARDIIALNRAHDFARWLSDHGLLPYTLNGFPHGDFHQPTVKHRVYHPDWRSPDRLNYTLDLITILDTLLEPGAEGSISTLPIGWREDFASDEPALNRAVQNLLRVVNHLADHEQRTGRLIHLDLEPEPGCLLQTSQDVVSLFVDRLDRGGDARRIRRYLRVCYDVCHTAVMFEGQAAALERYKQAGIQIGKVQLSSAVAVDFDRVPSSWRAAALEQLAGFAEDRYLHQTTTRTQGDGCHPRVTFFDDLPAALAACNGGQPAGEWRVHFHVPLFLEHIGELSTTHQQTADFLSLVGPDAPVKHFEVETYAWTVLPRELQASDLADGIAQELDWVTRHAPAKVPS